MAIIISFKNRQQLETEKALKTMKEWDRYLKWEAANWQKVEELKNAEEHKLSSIEIDWLNSWVNEKNIVDCKVTKDND